MDVIVTKYINVIFPKYINITALSTQTELFQITLM